MGKAYLDEPMDCGGATITEYHAKFPGGLRWRLTPQGVEVEGRGLLTATPVMLEATGQFVEEAADAITAASSQFEVPPDLLVACAMTQSQGTPARKFVWRSPGYFADSSTPHLISAGICRMLVSDVQHYMRDRTLDHFALTDQQLALRAGAAFIRSNHACFGTGWDPVLVACAFNATGLYEEKSPDNVWRLRQRAMLLGYPTAAVPANPDPYYADDFARYFSAAQQLCRRPGARVIS